MSAPFTRATLIRGPGLITYNGHKFFSAGDIQARLAPAWAPVTTSLYAEVDKAKTDLVLKIPIVLWGAFENLGDVFPAAVMTPIPGSLLFGSSDTSLTILGRNGDQIVYTNAAVTQLAKLRLGVDQNIFGAAVEFTALCGNTANPEDVGAYYVTSTGNAYADSAFAKTNLLRQRWSAAWGTVDGFTSFVGQKGFDIDWMLQAAPVYVDGWGTRDYVLQNMMATAKCIPIGPTIAQIEAAALSQGVALGTLLSSSSADLSLTAGTHSVTLKNAGILDYGYAFGVEPLRLGEITFATTRGFAAGVPAAVAAVA